MLSLSPFPPNHQTLSEDVERAGSTCAGTWVTQGSQDRVAKALRLFDGAKESTSTHVRKEANRANEARAEEFILFSRMYVSTCWCEVTLALWPISILYLHVTCIVDILYLELVQGAWYYRRTNDWRRKQQECDAYVLDITLCLLLLAVVAFPCHPHHAETKNKHCLEHNYKQTCIYRHIIKSLELKPTGELILGIPGTPSTLYQHQGICGVRWFLLYDKRKTKLNFSISPTCTRAPPDWYTLYDR